MTILPRIESLERASAVFTDPFLYFITNSCKPKTHLLTIAEGFCVQEQIGGDALNDCWKVQTLFQKEKAKNAYSTKQGQVLYVPFAKNVFLFQLMID